MTTTDDLLSKTKPHHTEAATVMDRIQLCKFECCSVRGAQGLLKITPRVWPNLLQGSSLLFGSCRRRWCRNAGEDRTGQIPLQSCRPPDGQAASWFEHRHHFTAFRSRPYPEGLFEVLKKR